MVHYINSNGQQFFAAPASLAGAAATTPSLFVQEQSAVIVVVPNGILTPNHFGWQRLRFPLRLFHLLNLMEYEGLADLAHWDEKGTSFRVRKSKALVEQLLPYFFQQNKWKSFLRVSNNNNRCFFCEDAASPDNERKTDLTRPFCLQLFFPSNSN
jgi:hypothetical protein